jgi:DNA-binding MarR family transcriptional regulator
MDAQERLATALGALCNLFQLVTQPELRCRKLSPLAFYALQRAIQEADDSKRPGDAYSESRLVRETQLKDYEISRTCSRLRKRWLVTSAPASRDKRVHSLMPTEQGRSVLRKIMAGARETDGGRLR